MALWDLRGGLRFKVKGLEPEPEHKLYFNLKLLILVGSQAVKVSKLSTYNKVIHEVEKTINMLMRSCQEKVT